MVRYVVEQEKAVNRLRYDASLGGAVMSIPHFRESNFQEFDHSGISTLHSSTFRLADFLNMLPGQENHSRATFEVFTVAQLANSHHPYSSQCSQLGLAKLVCRFFNSMSGEGDCIRIRTTIGLFNLQREEIGIVVHFLTQNRAMQCHPLTQADFDIVRKSAQGKIRPSEPAFELVYNRNGAEDARWKSTSIL